MKDFKKFVGTEESKQQKQTESAAASADNTYAANPGDLPDINDFNPKDVDMIQNLTKKYAGNEGQLLGDILSVAEKNKKDGKLKNNDLDNFEKKITPMLNNQQKKMLKDIMGMIKDK